MANTVAASIETKLTVTETLDLGLDFAASSPTVSHVISGAAKSWDADSTPPITAVSTDQRSLSSGSDTIDLTAAPGVTVNGTPADVDMTGLKVRAFKFRASSDNTDKITIEGHATNGYDLFAGLSDGKVSLGPGEELLMTFMTGNPDVSSTVKVIHVTSADVDAIYDYIILAG